MGAARVVIGIAALLAACGRIGFAVSPGDARDDSMTDASPATARAVAAGGAHSCAIAAGVLSCWGDNNSGQLGLGDIIDRLVPTAVDASSTWVAVSGGLAHTCAVKAGGSLWCWGENGDGQLGLGAATGILAPMQVSLPVGVRAIASKYDSTCAVLVDGALWCWGVNSEGQLAQNTTASPISTPVRVGTSTGWTQVAMGQGHTLGIAAGSVLGSGRNTASELGLGQGADVQYRVMTPIDAGAWRTTSAGQNVSLAIRADDSLWGWGENSTGALGFATSTRRTVPELVASGPWLDAGIDTFHGCGITAPGSMQCWGRNVEGQLGRGDNTAVMIPTGSGTFTDWETVSVARFHTCAQKRDGSVWCTGANGAGELGTGDVARRNAWTQVTLP